MRNLWHEWKDFSLEKKLTTVIVPLVVVVIGAIVAPVILDRLKPSPPAKVLGAKLENVHVATHVTLDEFAATQKTASLTPGGDGPRMAAVVLQAVTGTTSTDGGTVTGGGEPSPDRDKDGVPDATDECPDRAAQTESGCPDANPGGEPSPDRDKDGVPDATDECPDQAAQTKSGCPDANPGAGSPDRDKDEVPDATDNCPSTPNADQKDSNGDGRGDACPLQALEVQIDHAIDTGCSRGDLHKALRGDMEECKAVAAIVGATGASADARARAVLRALRHTRSTSDRPGGRRKPEGVEISFVVTLEGGPGRRADVRWSLRRARGGGRLPYSWLYNHRVLGLKGQAATDSASADFWVPLPQDQGPYKVRVAVYDGDGTRLTYRDTHQFS